MLNDKTIAAGETVLVIAANVSIAKACKENPLSISAQTG